MYFAENNKDFSRLYNGAQMDDVLRHFSLSLLNKLRSKGLITINSSNRIFITYKGEVARKIGLNKYLELERLEIKTLNYSRKKLTLYNVLLVLFWMAVVYWFIRLAY